MSNVKKVWLETLTSEAILVFPSLREPDRFDKYSCTLAFEDNKETEQTIKDLFSMIGKALRSEPNFNYDSRAAKMSLRAYKSTADAEETAKAGGYYHGIRVADVDKLSEYGDFEGVAYTIKFNSKNPIPIVDGSKRQLNELPDSEYRDLVYSGCRVRAAVTPYVYNVNGTKGCKLYISILGYVGKGTKMVKDKADKMAGLLGSSILSGGSDTNMGYGDSPDIAEVKSAFNSASPAALDDISMLYGVDKASDIDNLSGSDLEAVASILAEA